MSKTKVVIATPLKEVAALDAPHPFYRTTLEQLALLEDSPYEFHVASMEGGICHARNKMVDKAKKLGAKWVVWWDYDIEPAPADILRLLGHKLPIVAALYTTRTDKNPHYVANFMHEVEVQKDGLLQVIEAGTGLQVNHIQVFENLDRIYPTIAYTDRDTGERLHAYFQQIVLQTDLKPDGDWLTEDYFFHYLCRLAKIGIFVDTKIKVKHRGKDGKLYPAEWPPVPVDA
jgi:hypothetical protein